MAHIYPEKTLHLSAIGWMKANWNYVEIASDEEATGARMDSIGLLGGEIIAIEVKTSIHAGMAFHVQGKGGSLESKIAETLRKLRGGEHGTQIDMIRDYWDGKPLNIAILTESMTDVGFSELMEMLASRAPQWGFRYRVWVWHGEKIDVRAIGPTAADLEGRTFESASIPTLTGKSNRLPAKSFDEWYSITRDLGFGDTLPAMISLAKEMGFKLQRSGGCVSLSRDDLIAGKTVATIFVASANPVNGFNVGLRAETLNVSNDILPGNRAPREGFLNTNIYIKSVTEFSALLDVVTKGVRWRSGYMKILK